MLKEGILFLVLALICISTAFAEESLTITTYYPSPAGVYNRLQTNSLGVGDNNGNNKLDSGDVPGKDGDAWIKGNVGIGTMSPNDSKGESGYLDAKDVYIRDVGKWASQIGGVPLNGNSALMDLPVGTYTVLCWATYFTCEDMATSLLLDAAAVKTYSGAGGDTEGCDQNTIMVRLTGISGGSHAWSISRGDQFNYMWVAYLNT